MVYLTGCTHKLTYCQSCFYYSGKLFMNYCHFDIYGLFIVAYNMFLFELFCVRSFNRFRDYSGILNVIKLHFFININSKYSELNMEIYIVYDMVIIHIQIRNIINSYYKQFLKHLDIPLCLNFPAF